MITARKRSLGQGNIFRSVCQEFCSQAGGWFPSMHCKYLGRGSQSPHPRRKLRGLARGGFQAHTWGVSRPTPEDVSRSRPGGSPGPHPGVSPGPHLGGSPGPHLGGSPAHTWGWSPGPHPRGVVYPSMHEGRHLPLWYASYWNAFLFLLHQVEFQCPH